MSEGLRIGQRKSRLRVFRATELTGTLRSGEVEWEAQGETWGGFLPSFLTLRSYGAGEAPDGMREVHLSAGADVRERDGVEVLRGPEKGTFWRVLDVDRADAKRLRVRVEPYSGTFA